MHKVEGYQPKLQTAGYFYFVYTVAIRRAVKRK